MISYSSALEGIIETGRRQSMGTESVRLEDAIGRVLAEDLYSAENIPNFNNSAMDGFCLCAEVTRNATALNPARLRVVGLIAAGDSSPHMQVLNSEGSQDSCVEIMTGAPIPNGEYDSVVKIEDVLFEKDSTGHISHILIPREIKKGENVRLLGTDYNVGQKVLSHATEIEPHHVLICATLGIAEVHVRRRMRIAVLSTGNELVPYTTKELEPGKIRNSTGPYLSLYLKGLGADVSYLGIQSDDRSAFRDLLRKICNESYDIVISTGAVSMGKYDFVMDVLQELDAKIHFHKTAIRPGKPILFAELSGNKKSVAYFGVPGNPVSTAVACKFFIEPYLNALSGIRFQKPLQARLALPVRKPKGLRCFFKGRVHFDPDGLQVEVLKSQASYVVSSLSYSNCWVCLPEDGEVAVEGSLFAVYPLSKNFTGDLL